MYFNPRSPYGERLSGKISVSTAFQFQSTLPLRGATATTSEDGGMIRISIHAPLTGSDLVHVNHPVMVFQFQSTLPLRGATATHSVKRRSQNISIHAPLTGSDRACPWGSSLWRNFNPRSPYGERQRSCIQCRKCSYFNPRSPYGERPPAVRSHDPLDGFQSTLPLRGATKMWDHKNSRSGFQSTLPLRGATRKPART